MTNAVTSSKKLLPALREIIGSAASTVEIPIPEAYALAFEIPGDAENRRAAALALLQPAERQRHGKTDRSHQDSFLFGRASLRHLLATSIGVAASALEFEVSPQGKPRFASLPIFFNVSHSGDWVALVFSEDHSVGIDIEAERETPRAHGLARRFFDPVEATYVESLKGPVARDTFLRMWTAKEALIKARGGAIPTDLPKERVQVPFTTEIRPVGSGAKLIEIRGIPRVYGHIAALDSGP